MIDIDIDIEIDCTELGCKFLLKVLDLSSFWNVLTSRAVVPAACCVCRLLLASVREWSPFFFFCVWWLMLMYTCYVGCCKILRYIFMLLVFFMLIYFCFFWLLSLFSLVSNNYGCCIRCFMVYNINVLFFNKITTSYTNGKNT